MALKSWAEASASPAYQNATPEQQAQMKERYKAAGGVIPDEKPAQQAQPEDEGFVHKTVESVGEGISNFVKAGGASISQQAANAVGGLTSMVEDKLGTETDYGKRISQNAKELYQKRMGEIEEGMGKTAGQYAGIGLDIGMTVANPLLAAGIISGRETGRAYADQTDENKSATNALIVGGANYAAQRLLPGQGGETAKTMLGRIAGKTTSAAIAGAKGGAAVGAAEALSKNGDDTDLTDITAGAIEGAGYGALYGGAIGGIHAAVTSPKSKAFERTPEEVKTDIGAERDSVSQARNVDELSQAVANAKTTNTAGALDLLDKNDFRITDAVAVDNPYAQKILNTDQSKAEHAATTQLEKSNIPGVNPFAHPTKERGKGFADMEHNQKQAVAMIDAMKDHSKNNVEKLTSVLEDAQNRHRQAKVDNDFAGTDTDLKASIVADSNFIDAYKKFANESSTFKARTGEDLDLYNKQAVELQKLYDDPNLSPEMRQAVQGLTKIRGMQDGFTPIQDAHILNETAKLMDNQDRGWRTATTEGFKEASAPSLTKNPYGLLKFGVNRLTASRSRAARVGQQEANRKAIQELASSDLAVAKSRADVAKARDDMENPPEDPIPFEKSNENAEPEIKTPEDVMVPQEAPKSEPTPDGLETPFQRYQRIEAEKAAAAKAVAEADVDPVPRQLGVSELARAPRKPLPKEPQPEPVVEPTPEPVAEPTPPAQEAPILTARELVEAQRRAKAANKAREEANKPTEEPVVEEQPKAEPLPTQAPKAPEKAPEPVKPKEGSEKLAALSTHERVAAETRAKRFARSLYSAAAKAKATAENFLAYKGDYRELMRSIREQDNAMNVARHEEMARNQLASQQGIATAKSRFVRDQFAEWAKERGLPEKHAIAALKAEQKGENGNVTSLDALKRRAEKLYQKQIDDDFNRMYEEALKENKRLFPDERGPDLKSQKEDFFKEVDTLLKDEHMSPAQKAAVKSQMEDFINDKFKAAEKAGREDGFETGQMKDLWTGLFNEYKRHSGTFLKANKQSQYEMAADAIASREKRLTEALTKRQATLEARAQKARDIESTKAMASQRNEVEEYISKVPEEIRESLRKITMHQLSSHHDRGSPVPPERYRYLIERIGNEEYKYLERKQNATQKEKEEAQSRYDRMVEQAHEMNRKFDVAKRSEAKEAEEAKLQKQNDWMAVQRQRDDIHSRLMDTLKEKGITGEDAEKFAGSYMDTRYSLLEKPMTPVEHQNARSRIEADVDRFAKKYETMSSTEKEIELATGGDKPDPKLHGEDTVKATEKAREVESEVEKLRQEELEMQKTRAGLKETDSKDGANMEADIKAAQAKSEEAFISKVEKAFSEGKDLRELSTLAELLDRVQGVDTTGNNRRFVTVLQKAANNKAKYGDNPVAWIDADDYMSIAKLGNTAAGGNKSRALIKIFGVTADEASRKLLGPKDVAKIRNIIEKNPNDELPKYSTSSRADYKNFMEQYHEDGSPKKRGSLRIARGEKTGRSRILRVKPKAKPE